MSNKGWYGVDLDGTLAYYDKWRGVEHVGEPIEPMVDRVRQWIAEGKEVRIFTARIAPYVEMMLSGDYEPAVIRDHMMKVVDPIWAFCDKYIGTRLAVTCLKDMGMIECWDDRATEVAANTGIPVNPAKR